MSDNVIDFQTRDGFIGPGLTVPVADVLDAAKGCVKVMVIGLEEDGSLYMATSHAEYAPLLLVRAMQNL
jgi:hypothetical protein